MPNKGHTSSRLGFTLVELLVVIAIIGSLIALLLPAVQSAREAARRVHCKNNIKQIALGVLLHEDALGHFPYGGWGHEWVGMSGRGSKENQPGGWIYNILPYIEQENLHQLGASTNSPNADEQYSRRLSTPICLFACPSRRRCTAWQVDDSKAYFSQPKPAGKVLAVARSDYAINAGTTNVSNFRGPVDLQSGDAASFNWPMLKEFNGISHLRVGAEARELEDGRTHTYLIGEKFLNPNNYFDGKSRGDNETIYSGYCSDLHRYTRVDLFPLKDTTVTQKSPGYLRFGSAHPGSFHISLCDGSVKTVSYDIGPVVHYRLGNRRDQEMKLASSL